MAERTLELSDSNDQLKESLTDLKLATEELEETNVELEASLENLKDTQDHLVQSEKMAALGKLTAGVSHEINTPLGVCLTASTYAIHLVDQLRSVMAHKKRDEDELELIDDIKSSTDVVVANLKKASQIVENFRKLAEDHANESVQQVAVQTYLENVVANIETGLDHPNVDISIQCAPMIEVKTRPGVLFLILNNLIENAVNHGFRGQDRGTILIEVSQTVTTTTLVVHDDGVGIGLDHIDRLFEPYYTVDNVKDASGMGLNTVYNMVTKKLGGTIEVVSKVGEGTSFVIGLPNVCGLVEGV